MLLCEEQNISRGIVNRLTMAEDTYIFTEDLVNLVTICFAMISLFLFLPSA